MSDHLMRMTAEVRARLEGTPAPTGSPQLLGVWMGQALVRGVAGLKTLPVAELPPHTDFSPIIDHTVLKADAGPEDIEKLCQEAMEHHFASVCVNPIWVARCNDLLGDSGVRVCTVVGFPLGAMRTPVKALEAEDALHQGAREIDMVLPIGPARAGDWETVRKDIATLRRTVPVHQACLKVILETCLLSPEAKAEACRIAAGEGVDFVKTSTGFSTGGATEGDVRLMRQLVGAHVGVKASGGVRSYADALRMVMAGATRLGLSASIAVVQGGTSNQSY